MKRIIALTLLSLFSVSMLSACNTISGAGKDIEAAGDKIDDKALKALIRAAVALNTSGAKRPKTKA